MPSSPGGSPWQAAAALNQEAVGATHTPDTLSCMYAAVVLLLVQFQHAGGLVHIFLAVDDRAEVFRRWAAALTGTCHRACAQAPAHAVAAATPTPGGCSRRSRGSASINALGVVATAQHCSCCCPPRPCPQQHNA